MRGGFVNAGVVGSVIDDAKAKVAWIWAIRKLNVFATVTIFKICAVWTKRKAIAQVRLFRVSVTGLEVNGESERRLVDFYKWYVGIVILMVGKDHAEAVSLRKR